MSKFTPTPFLTSTGRLLWGDLYTPRTTDFDGNPLVTKSGPNAGAPRVVFDFGVAFAKRPGETHFGQSELGAIIWAQGHKDHPQSAPRPDFAWKVTDGDSQVYGKPYKGKSTRPCDKEGYPGHWVFSFGGGDAPRIVNHDGSAYILDKDAVQAGDCVQVSGSVVGNEGASPGVYLNHRFVSFQGPHRDGRIVQGADPKTLGFGAGPQFPGQIAMPAGAMAAPPVSVPTPGAALSPPPPAQTPPPVYAAPAAMTPPAIVQPHPGFLNPAAAAALPPPPAALPPPPAAGPQMSPKAGGQPYGAFIAAGWKHEQLQAGGYLL